jgi:hypothetical protein
MTKSQQYLETLRTLPISEWDAYLKAKSGLPGPRGNLELIQAVADAGDEALFLRYLELTPEQAPVNSPEEFLVACGAVGLGRLLAEGCLEYFARLRQLAADPRWRTREAVAMALQRFGRVNMPRLLEEMRVWSVDSPYVQRAVVAGLCEPDLLRDPAQVTEVLKLLDEITASIEGIVNRKDEGFIALRKGLAYGWSVAAIGYPQLGKEWIEKWLASADKDIRWIMRENLKKNRLVKLDPEWVERMRALA